MADRGETPDDAEREWRAGWEDQQGITLEASMAATPLQRLEWLEEALALAWEAGALGPRRQRTDSAKLR
jgi:hypothetical protein